MCKLANRMKNVISLNGFSSHITNTNNKYCVFLSDSNSPGEGEHKIMNFVRNNNKSPQILIYGLDADLIILSMIQDKSNIQLLREPQNTTSDIQDFSVDNEFIYLDINAYTTSFIKEYNLQAYDRTNVLYDVMFVSFFGGNDFVEPFINTRIREKNNFTKLMNLYVTILQKTQQHIINIDSLEINQPFFISMVEKIAETENGFVKKKANSFQFSGEGGGDNNLTAYEQELQNYYHAPYTSETNPFNGYYSNHMHLINYKLPHESWKKQYYKYFYPNSYTIDDSCQDYLRSLIWTLQYYTKEGVPSWTYHFKGRVAPCPSDFICFLKNDSSFDYTFEKSDVIAPIEQLVIVTPIQHANVLPWSFQQFYKELSPVKFHLDVLKGGKNIYSDPILPDIDRDDVNALLRNIPVTEIEKLRNTIKTKLFCMKF